MPSASSSTRSVATIGTGRQTADPRHLVELPDHWKNAPPGRSLAVTTKSASRCGKRWRTTAHRLEILGFLKRRNVVDGVIVYTKMAQFPKSASLPFLKRNLPKAAAREAHLARQRPV